MRSLGSKLTLALFVAAASASSQGSHSSDTCESSGSTSTHKHTAPPPMSTDSGYPICVFCTPTATHTHVTGNATSLHTASSCTTVSDCSNSTPPWAIPTSTLVSVPGSISATTSIPASTAPWMTDSTSSVTTIYKTVPCTESSGNVGATTSTTASVPASGTPGSGTNGTVTTGTAKQPPPTITTSGAAALFGSVGSTMKKCFVALAVVGLGLSML